MLIGFLVGLPIGAVLAILGLYIVRLVRDGEGLRREREKDQQRRVESHDREQEMLRATADADETKTAFELPVSR